MDTQMSRKASPCGTPDTACGACTRLQCPSDACDAQPSCPQPSTPQPMPLTRRQAIAGGTRALLGTVLGAGLLSAAGCADEAEITAPDGASPDLLQRALARNEANRDAFEALAVELEPHLRPSADGTWTIAPNVVLSPGARRFVDVAAHEMKGVVGDGALIETGRAPLPVAAYVGSNYTGIRWYWWGARISLSSANVGALASTVRLAGVGGAVQFFVRALLAPVWVVNIVPLLVAYWMAVISAVNAAGGRRGVHIDVTWATLILVRAQ